MVNKVTKLTTLGPSPDRPRRWSTSRLTEQQFAYLLLVPLAATLLAILAFPLVYSIWLSLNQILLGRGTWTFVGLDQYVRAFGDSMFWHSTRLTFTYTVATTVITYAVALAGALLLNENFRGRRFLILLVILPWALSTYATAMLWRYIYSEQIGLLNALLLGLGLVSEPVRFLSPEFAIYAVAVAHAWQMAPFGIYFLLAALQTIPPDLYRVARIDRLGVLGRFRHVTLPYLRGPMLAMAMLTVLAAARIFDILYFVANGGPGNASTTLTYYIYSITFRAYDIGYGSALSQILLVLILAMMVVYFWVLMSQRKAGRP